MVKFSTTETGKQKRPMSTDKRAFKMIWMWIVPLLPLILLLTSILILLIVDWSSPATSWSSSSAAIQTKATYSVVFLMIVSVLVGVVMLLVTVLLLITQVVAIKDFRTLLSIGLACADIAIPVGIFFWWASGLRDLKVVFL